MLTIGLAAASNLRMIENNHQDVSTAFEILLEEVEAEIEFINSVGSKAFEARDYSRARGALERAETLTAFRDKIATLREEWSSLAAVSATQEDEQTRTERRNLGRLRKGLRTPEARYRAPILGVLVEMGGSGRAAEVLERVGQILRPLLKPVDFEPLASGPDNPRWRNAAQWARNAMVKEGLMVTDSARGIWEISDAGRLWLKTHASA